MKLWISSTIDLKDKYYQNIIEIMKKKIRTKTNKKQNLICKKYIDVKENNFYFSMAKSRKVN